MRLSFSDALEPGQTVVIRMDFEVTVPQGLGGNYGTFAYVDEVLALAVPFLKR